MPIHQQIFKLCLFLILVTSTSSQLCFAQDSKKEKQAAEAESTKNLISNKQYVFEAQSTTPTGGKLIQLSYGYAVKVSGDTLISNLPYYGRSYTATLPSENNGVNFTSVNFEYKIEERKKGGWDIIMIPEDYSDVQKLFLTVFENGSASLLVISKSKSNISYSGYITAPKQKK